jgi:hypothetical protein
MPPLFHGSTNDSSDPMKESEVLYGATVEVSEMSLGASEILLDEFAGKVRTSASPLRVTPSLF